MATTPHKPADNHKSAPPPPAKHEDQPGKREAKPAQHEYPTLTPENAASLFKNGHRIAKQGDPIDKWISMGRLSDGTPVLQTPMTQEAVDAIGAGEFYLAEGPPPATGQAPAPPAGPPVVVDSPNISGSGNIGEPLTCTMGNWENMGSSGWGETGGYRYQWKKMQSGNPSVIPDATTQTYAPTSLDANKDVFCTVLATNSVGEAASDSNTITVKPPAEQHQHHGKR